jgi:hypothetical protein
MSGRAIGRDALMRHRPPIYYCSWRLSTRRQCGALLEVGAALGADKQVFLVSPYEWSIAHHPNVRRFATLEDAIGELIKRGVPDTRAASIAPQRASLRACSVVVAQDLRGAEVECIRTRSFQTVPSRSGGGLSVASLAKKKGRAVADATKLGPLELAVRGL